MKDLLLEAVRKEARACTTPDDVADFVVRLTLLTVKVCMEVFRPLPTKDKLKELFATAVDRSYEVRAEKMN